jgi:hypothetical protein
VCLIGNMGHDGVILQSLYTKESGASEFQNHDQVPPRFSHLIRFLNQSGIRLSALKV